MSDSPAINTAQRVVNRVWLWRLVIFELVITCAVTAGMFYQSWMTGDTEWSSLAPGRKMTFEVGITMQVLMVIKAFLSKTWPTCRRGSIFPRALMAAMAETPLLSSAGARRPRRSKRTLPGLKNSCILFLQRFLFREKMTAMNMKHRSVSPVSTRVFLGLLACFNRTS